MKDRTIIGVETCPDCGSKVEQRVNQGGKVYWRCDATLGPGCGSQHTYGPGKSRTMIAAVADPAPPPAPPPPPKPAPKPAPVAKPLPTPPAQKPQPAPPVKAGWGSAW